MKTRIRVRVSETKDLRTAVGSSMCQKMRFEGKWMFGNEVENNGEGSTDNDNAYPFPLIRGDG